MSYFTPYTIEDLEKLKMISEQKKNIRKQRLNTKIQKNTMNYELAEQYAPITKVQEEQTKVIQESQQQQQKAIEDQTKAIQEGQQAIEDQTELLKAISAPPSTPIEDIKDEQKAEGKSIDSVISNMVSSLLNQINTHSMMKFTQTDFNNYKVKGKDFKVYDKYIEFDGEKYEVSPSFFKIFLKTNDVTSNELNEDEKETLKKFVEYAGGLGQDKKSKLYNATNKSPKKQDIKGKGISFIFLSSDPNVLVERLEVLVGESLAGNTNAYQEASAILHELLRINEISKTEYENAMKIFIS